MSDLKIPGRKFRLSGMWRLVTLLPWRQRQHIFPKLWYVST